jgi:hypothetical protein
MALPLKAKSKPAAEDKTPQEKAKQQAEKKEEQQLDPKASSKD